jgi:hypothetical protein
MNGIPERDASSKADRALKLHEQGLTRCACRKSNTHIQVMKSAKKWLRQNATNGMYRDPNTHAGSIRSAVRQSRSARARLVR